MNAQGRHIRPLGAALCLAVLAACARDSEAAQRARLSDWVSLGQTLSFLARRGCAVGVYAVVTGAVDAGEADAGAVDLGAAAAEAGAESFIFMSHKIRVFRSVNPRAGRCRCPRWTLR